MEIMSVTEIEDDNDLREQLSVTEIEDDDDPREQLFLAAHLACENIYQAIRDLCLAERLIAPSNRFDEIRNGIDQEHSKLSKKWILKNTRRNETIRNATFSRKWFKGGSSRMPFSLCCELLETHLSKNSAFQAAYHYNSLLLNPEILGFRIIENPKKMSAIFNDLRQNLGVFWEAGSNSEDYEHTPTKAIA